MTDLRQRWSASLLPTYQVPSLTLVRGEGAVVWDADANSYVDMFAGIAVNTLGHAHPALIAAVSAQLATLGHVSNLMASEPAVKLAEKLLFLMQEGASGASGKVYFANSGTEANEAALKLARRTGRGHFVATHGGFHGRTMGALSLTGQPAKRDPFAPLLPNVTHVPFGDSGALRAAVTEQTAMVILEPILGEAGVICPPANYLAQAREITRGAGALLAIDEVQTGIGRTGVWFAHQRAGIAPDIVTLAKGLGGGLPIGAMVAFGAAAQLLQPGDHGSTFGGNPVTCAAALAVLDTIEMQQLCERAAVLGHRLATGIRAVDHSVISGVRGEGLLLAIVLGEPVAPQLANALLERGFLVNTIGSDVIRLAPPLILTDEQADGFLAALGPACDAAASSMGAVAKGSVISKAAPA